MYDIRKVNNKNYEWNEKSYKHAHEKTTLKKQVRHKIFFVASKKEEIDQEIKQNLNSTPEAEREKTSKLRNVR